jgi:hypothetical protein
MQLVHPWFLLGLLTIAIPVVIHLLQLRKPQRVLFTNTAFIRDVELVTVRHRRLQQLLLLIARGIAVTALVIAFCQPFVPAKSSASGADSEVALSVDNSFSMQSLSVNGQRLFDSAVKEARILGQSTSFRKLRLLQGGGASVPKKVFLTKLDELGLNAKLGVAVSKGSPVEPLYVFSDFQRNSFGTKDIDALAGRRQAVLVPLVGKQVGNAYVDSLWLDDAFVRKRSNVGLHIRMRNGGAGVARDCPVKVFLGPRQVAAFRLTVEPGKETITVVQVQLDDDKLVLGRVIIEDSPITFDNAYCFTLQPAAAIRVMELGETPVARQVYGNEPLFTYAFAKAGNIDFGVLRRANVVLLHELPQVDAGLQEALGTALKRGASIVIIPTAATQGRESYQRLFKKLGIGTAQWEAQTAEAPELREVAMPGAQEPFFRNVFGAQHGAVTMPRVAPVLRWARTGTDILRLKDGEGYLAEFRSATGKVYVFSAPLEEKYSDFAQHALFVPVMYRMAMLSYQNEQLPAYRLSQSNVTLQLPAAGESVKANGVSSDEAGIRLVKDSLALIPAQRIQGNEVRLALPVGMDAPGFYQVQRNGKLLTTLAFNLDKRESELAAYSADELRQLIGPNHPNIRVVESGSDGAGITALQAEQTGTPLWRYFILLALLALLAEVLLVRFGRRVAKVPGATTVRAA